MLQEEVLLIVERLDEDTVNFCVEWMAGYMEQTLQHNADEHGR